MWDRASIKAAARARYFRNFGVFLLVGIIGFFLFGNTGNNSGLTVEYRNRGGYEFRDHHGPRDDFNNVKLENMSVKSEESVGDIFRDSYVYASPFLAILRAAGIILTGASIIAFMIIGSIVKIFVFNPILVGEKKFYLDSLDDDIRPVKLLYYHKNGYTLRLGIKILFKDLLILLFTLLLVVPGIIKSYQYYFVPYILADDPDLSLTDAINISKTMTGGMKMDLFIFDMSFILWHLLLGIAFFGIGESFLRPYIEISRADIYRHTREFLARDYI